MRTILSDKSAARWLVGRTIVKVEMRPFPNGRGGTATDPVFVLDDGSQVKFEAQETESAQGYGIEVEFYKGAGGEGLE